MISVIIPLYNKEKQIAATLKSVIEQTFQDFEIIVVNDGSTDNSATEVLKVKDPHIRLIHQENTGVSAARNRGIQEARFDLIAFLDADDNWKPNYLENQYELSKKYPQCSVYACNYEFRNADGTITSTIIRRLPFQESEGILSNYFEVASCSHPPIWTSAVMVRKEAIQAIGGFPIGIKSGEDLLTWARLAANYQIAYSKEVCAIFNVEGYDFSEKPKRLPAEPDVVGKALKELADNHTIPNLNQYISHWHKMRSSIYLRLNMRKKSIEEALIALRHHPTNYKLYIYILLNFIPSRLRPF